MVKLCVLLVLATAGVTVGAAQTDPPLPDASTPTYQRPIRRDKPYGLNEMLAKQKAARDKKDHEEMLARGEQAMKLANQLEAAFAQNKGLTTQDRQRLESLEEMVIKIRKELGGDDDEEAEARPSEEPKPSTVEEAFTYLKSTTVKLVDELKKTTRYSISAIAIQTSNSVLKIVKFLRIRK